MSPVSGTNACRLQRVTKKTKDRALNQCNKERNKDIRDFTYVPVQTYMPVDQIAQMCLKTDMRQHVCLRTWFQQAQLCRCGEASHRCDSQHDNQPACNTLQKQDHMVCHVVAQLLLADAMLTILKFFRND